MDHKTQLRTDAMRIKISIAVLAIVTATMSVFVFDVFRNNSVSAQSLVERISESQNELHKLIEKRKMVSARTQSEVKRVHEALRAIQTFDKGFCSKRTDSKID